MSQFIKNITDRFVAVWKYCADGVWGDTRRTWWINMVKTLNITVKSFLDRDIQSQACALTYRTLLAIVPALALLFAIGRGFGFQNLLQDELHRVFPAQHQMITYALSFVDSYLNQASEGLFVGVGIVFLLWTLISLVSSVEDAFNRIWIVKEGRSIWRKITDYTAMFLILPVLMICSSGLTIFVSSSLSSLFEISFMTPVLTVLFEFASWIFTWLFFAAVFMLIPNTRVRFGNALIAGIFSGTGFRILQWLFVSGQLYVSKYNAIYGSFSFLPLLLLWMQLAWVVCLSGALICYASQNIFLYSFSNQVKAISPDYNRQVTVAVAAAIVQRFTASRPPLTSRQIAMDYGLPSRLVSEIIRTLCRAGVVSTVVIDEKKEIYGYQPAVDPGELTVAELTRRINDSGMRDFIPGFNTNFPGVTSAMSEIDKANLEEAEKFKLSDIQITKTIT